MVRAKLVCTSKKMVPHTKSNGEVVEAAQLTFRAVYNKGPSSKERPGGDWSNAPENAIFGEFTPSCDMTMYVTNPEAHKHFRIEGEYYLDFSAAE